jgi:hypothetical protein
MNPSVFHDPSRHTRLASDSGRLGRVAGVERLGDDVLLLRVESEMREVPSGPNSSTAETTDSRVVLSRLDLAGRAVWTTPLGVGWTNDDVLGHLRVTDGRVEVLWARYDGTFPIPYDSEDGSALTLVLSTMDSDGQNVRHIELPAALPASPYRWSTSIAADGSVGLATRSIGGPATVTRFRPDGHVAWTESLHGSERSGGRVQVLATTAGLTVATTGDRTAAWDASGHERWTADGRLMGVAPIENVSDRGRDGPDVMLTTGGDDLTGGLCVLDADGSMLFVADYGRPPPLRAWWTTENVVIFNHQLATGSVDALNVLNRKTKADDILVLGTTGDVVPIYGTQLDDIVRSPDGGLTLVGTRTDDSPGTDPEPETWRFLLTLPPPAGNGDLSAVPRG